MGFADRVRACDVRDASSYARYVQQTTGVPNHGAGDYAALNKSIRDFKDRYPHLADNPWPTFVKVAQWCRSKRKRPSSVAALLSVMLTWAWQDGALPELDPTLLRDQKIETAIAQALAEEGDPHWRDRLIGAEGTARGEVLAAWQMRRSSLSPA